MAALEEEDIVEDQQFEALLTFTPEVQEAIEQACSPVICTWDGNGFVVKAICDMIVSVYVLCTSIDLFL